MVFLSEGPLKHPPQKQDVFVTIKKAQWTNHTLHNNTVPLGDYVRSITAKDDSGHTIYPVAIAADGNQVFVVGNNDIWGVQPGRGDREKVHT